QNASADRVAHETKRARRSERFFLAQVVDLYAVISAVLKVRLDLVREIVHRQMEPADPEASETIDQDLEDRRLPNHEERLRDRRGEGTKARALPAGHDHRLADRLAHSDETHRELLRVDRNPIARIAERLRSRILRH